MQQEGKKLKAQDLYINLIIEIYQLAYKVRVYSRNWVVSSEKKPKID